MGKVKEIFTNIRVIILVIFLLSLIIAISPNPFNDGVAIRSVGINKILNYFFNNISSVAA